VFNFTGRYIALTGGRGSGKSWFIAHYLLELCLHKQIDVLCAREHQESIEKSSYKLLKKIIQKYKLPYKVTNEKIISLTTGAQFDFIGLSDITAENVKSSEDYGIAWLEEAQKISEMSWRYLRPTIRKPGSKIFISMNPLVPHEKNPIMSDIYADSLMYTLTELRQYLSLNKTASGDMAIRKIDNVARGRSFLSVNELVCLYLDVLRFLLNSENVEALTKLVHVLENCYDEVILMRKKYGLPIPS
jgi:PBSX family phage terminase large subunit